MKLEQKDGTLCHKALVFKVAIGAANLILKMFEAWRADAFFALITVPITAYPPLTL